MSEPLQPPGDGAADSRGTAGQAGSGTQSRFPGPPPQDQLFAAARPRPGCRQAPATRVIANRDSEPAPAKVGAVEHLSVKGVLHQRLLDELDRRNLLGAGEETFTEFVQTFVHEALRAEGVPLNEAERRRLVEDLLEETLGVGPLASLMADPAVTDILVNRPQQVYIERFGRWRRPTCASATPTTWCGSSSGSRPASAGGSTRARRWSMRGCPTAAASTPRCRR